MKRFAVVLLLVLILCDYSIGKRLGATDRSLVIKSWTTENGLPQRTVQTIIQDSRGYIWIGTQEGLVRFDGSEFVSFRDLLGNNYILNMFEDSSRDLWIGTFGKGLIKFSSGKITRYDTGNSGLESDIVRGIAEREDGEIFIATQRGLFELQGDEIVKVELPAQYRGIRFNSVVYHPATGLIGATEKGLIILDKELKLTGIIDEAAGLESETVLAVAVDGEEKLVVGTRKGLHIVENGRVIEKYGKKDGLANDIVVSLFVDKKSGEILIGTERGVSLMKGKHFYYFHQLQKLGQRAVWDVYRDSEGNYWIGSGEGLKMFYNGNIYNFSVDEGVADDSCWGVTEMKDGTTWVGTRYGISIISQGKVVGSIDEVKGHFVRGIFESSRGEIWIGTESGIYRKTPDKTEFITVKDGLVNNVVKTFAEDDEGGIWIGTQGGVSCFYNGKFKNYTIEEGLANNSVRRLLWFEGKLWIATDNGLNCLDKGSFKSYNKRDGLADNVLISLSKGGCGELWITTFDGLTLMKDGKFHSFSKKDGLFSDFIYEVVEDKGGRVWMSCNRGIFFIEKINFLNSIKDPEVKLFYNLLDETDGMKDSECNGGNHCSGLLSSKGNIWFVTAGGVCRIDPDSYKRIGNNARVTLETLSSDYETPYIIDKAAILGPGMGRLEIHYSAICFREPQEVKFSFFLEGYDKEWFEAGIRKTAYYTNLNPGNYTFYVKATDNEDKLETLEECSIVIQPFFHQTLTFKVILVLLVILSGFLIYTLRTRSLRKKKLELENLVDQRTKELKAAALKDPLTGLQNRRFLDEIIETEIPAFIGLKNYALKNSISRRTLPEESVFGIVMFDIDHFKRINDTHGHKAGDLVLKKFSNILKESVRADDIVVRWGGEEFMVILKKTHRSYISGYIERVIKRIREETFSIGRGIKIGLTCSVGAVGFPCDDTVPDAYSFEQTVVIADNALYFSKRTGRNRATYVLAGEEFSQGDKKHLVVGNLKWGIRNKYVNISVTK